MKAASVISLDRDSTVAAANCITEILTAGVGQPGYIMIQANAGLNLGEIVRQVLTKWPTCSVHAATSCLGSMGTPGLAMADEAGVVMLAIEDPEGDYGSAAGSVSSDIGQDMKHIVLEALMNADRSGEVPALVWVSGTPGQEEAMIAGIEATLGPDIPIIGGSAADNSISGDWRVASSLEPIAQGAVVSVFFPSVRLGTSFHSGYMPGAHQGRVTQCEGRRILRIDGRPAAQVYSEWVGGTIPVPESGSTNVLMASALSPLGRVRCAIGGTPIYLLSHPETLSADGYMTLFTEVEEGDELILMHGTEGSLVERAAEVALSACRVADINPAESAATLLVYCGGCMLSVRHRVQDIHDRVSSALPGSSLITAFTFGEQGNLCSGLNDHGNLMISAVVFGREGT
jgi:hypothetical protein